MPTIGGFHLRPYGPGKYNLVIDEFVDSILEPDDTAGDVDTYGWWAGRVAGEATNGLLFTEGPYEKTLTRDEIAFLMRQKGGAILYENDQGFVKVNYFESPAAAMQAWAEWEETEARDKPKTYRVRSWSDHDRFYIAIVDEDNEVIVQWSDDEARALIEDGFYNPGRAGDDLINHAYDLRLMPGQT